MRRNSSVAGRMRWGVLALAVSIAATLFVVTSGAQALVVNDQGTTAGVRLVPGTSVPFGVTPSTSGAPCSDPAMGLPEQQYLSFLPGSNPLCWRGGSVMYANESFALTWDPFRRYWAGTRGYLEQFLRDVADGSGSLSSPYADTTQYTDSSGRQRAANKSIYGGGCIDYGNPTNSSNSSTSCLFGSSVQTGPGNNYPGNGCAPSGTSYVYQGPNTNDICLTDSQLKGEISTIVQQMGIVNRTQAGYTPVITMLVPPRVEVCLDSSGNLCSANSAANGTFCTYHSQLQLPDGTRIAYVVQPWTAYTGCDEPKLPQLDPNSTPAKVATDAGTRIVSPLSQGHIAAIVDPGVTDGWVANDGSEVNDNGGCAPFGADIDKVPVGNGSYVLQREYTNSAAIENDPNTYFGCVPNVLLDPAFAVPSAVEPGDVVVFDGSVTASTLLVPNADFVWSFGDGSGATGPSVTHSYGQGGNYTVTLKVTDRGGNSQTLAQTISVLGFNGLPVPPANPPTANPTNTGKSSTGLQVRMQLLPQSLRGVLRSGIAVQVSANEPATGIASVSISRQTARRLHMRLGRGPAVVIGRGTISTIKDGTVVLHFKLARSTVTKLKTLRHVALTLKLQVIGVARDHLVIDAAGRY